MPPPKPGRFKQPSKRTQLPRRVRYRRRRHPRNPSPSPPGNNTSDPTHHQSQTPSRPTQCRPQQTEEQPAQPQPPPTKCPRNDEAHHPTTETANPRSQSTATRQTWFATTPASAQQSTWT